jgi:ferritin
MILSITKFKNKLEINQNPNSINLNSINLKSINLKSIKKLIQSTLEHESQIKINQNPKQ